MTLPTLISIQLVTFFVLLFGMTIFVIRKILGRKLNIHTIMLSNVIVTIAVASGVFSVGVGTLLNSVFFAWSGMPYPGESSDTIRINMIYTIISVIITMGYALDHLFKAFKRYLK